MSKEFLLCLIFILPIFSVNADKFYFADEINRDRILHIISKSSFNMETPESIHISYNKIYSRLSMLLEMSISDMGGDGYIEENIEYILPQFYSQKSLVKNMLDVEEFDYVLKFRIRSMCENFGIKEDSKVPEKVRSFYGDALNFYKNTSKPIESKAILLSYVMLPLKDSIK